MDFPQADKSVKRLREDLEASEAVCAEIRSQLDDARSEIQSLKESRATAEVFSLELADYERRVSCASGQTVLGSSATVLGKQMSMVSQITGVCEKCSEIRCIV